MLVGVFLFDDRHEGMSISLWYWQIPLLRQMLRTRVLAQRNTSIFAYSSVMAGKAWRLCKGWRKNLVTIRYLKTWRKNFAVMVLSSKTLSSARCAFYFFSALTLFLLLYSYIQCEKLFNVCRLFSFKVISGRMFRPSLFK